MGSNRKSFQRSMPKACWPTVLFAMLAASMALGTAGCFLPLLGAIPSVVSLAHSLYTSGGTDDADAKNQDPEPVVEGARLQVNLPKGMYAR